MSAVVVTLPVSLTWPRRLFPLLCVQAYLWATLLFFIYGPWNWELANSEKLLAFVTASHLAFAVGYLLCAHTKPRETKYRPRATKLVAFAVLVTLIVLPFTNYAKTGSLVPNVAAGITDPGEAYAQVHQLAEGGGNAASYVRILLSPILVLLVPLTVFYWSRLKRSNRILAVVAISGVLALTIASGQRRDIADLLVTLPFLIVASHWAQVSALSRRARITIFLTTLGAFGLFLAYFAYSHVSRVGESTAVYAANPATGQLPDKESALLSAVPEEAQAGALAFLNYVTTGYYGLSLSLEREWKPMYGYGHSMFLTRNAERFAQGRSLESRSLPVQISDKDGFRYPILWCTAYPYFINDLGTVGVVVLMGALGALMAVSWVDVIGRADPLALAVFWMLLLLAIYLPATNRVLQDGEGVVAFYVLVGAYLFCRHKGRSEVTE